MVFSDENALSDDYLVKTQGIVGHSVFNILKPGHRSGINEITAIGDGRGVGNRNRRVCHRNADSVVGKMKRVNADIGIDQHKSRCCCERFLVTRERNVGEIRTDTSVEAYAGIFIFLNERVL